MAVREVRRGFVMADDCREYYNRARESYKTLFMDPDSGYINNLVSTDDFALGRQPIRPRIARQVAAAILGRDIFSLRELEGIAAFAKARLMRNRWGMPFGIVVKDPQMSVPWRCRISRGMV